MKQKSVIEPTIGRNIRYVIRDGECRAAIVTRVFPGMLHSEVNLTIFVDKSNDYGVIDHASSAPYDPDKALGTWHWPADAGDRFPTPAISTADAERPATLIPDEPSIVAESAEPLPAAGDGF